MNYHGAVYLKKLLPAIMPLLLLVFAYIPTAVADDCLDCHGEKDLEAVSPERKGMKLFVTADMLKGSTHEDVGCGDCHQSDAGAEKPHYEGGPAPQLMCVTCHEESVGAFEKKDVHGRLHAKGSKDAAWCSDCHGSHDIKKSSSADSPVSADKQADTCGKCHNDTEQAPTKNIPKRKLLERYRSGVHFMNKKDGRPSAVCSDCHGAHGIRASAKMSRVERIESCGKCHEETLKNYMDGAHGKTLASDNADVPDCISCHGDHDIISLEKHDGKRDYAATQTCIWCHGNKRMMARYGLDTSQVESYQSDFHGLTQRSSLGASATCADCHDAHMALNHNDPKSKMHPSNRAATCGACHGDSSEAFLASFTHKIQNHNNRFMINRIVTIVYIALILLTIGGMLLHNFIIWAFYVRKKFKSQRHDCRTVRLSAGERVWHWTLFASFTLLGITGFALSFSESVAFKWMYDTFLTEQCRAWLHRVAAIIMLADMLIFLVIVTVKSRGRRKWWIEMLPRLHDISDIFKTMSYHLGISKERPRYHVFNYVEKAEYWALWWGTVIMALTGFVLWFSRLLPADTPTWLLDVSRTIHFYEAVLACLSIAVWHFFFVIWHPAEYPINLSSITGRLSDHEAEERFIDSAISAQREAESDKQANK